MSIELLERTRIASEVIDDAVEAACRRIAPLWPLSSFVAVNPFLGFRGESFHATCSTFERVARVNMLMPRAFYRDAIARGEILDADLAAALADARAAGWNVPPSVAAVVYDLRAPRQSRSARAAKVPTVAEVLDSLAGGDRVFSGSAFMIDEISKFLAAYFDRAQSSWRLPWRGERPYAAWREAVRYDRNAEVFGIANFSTIVGALPHDPHDAIAAIARLQGVPDRALTDYLHQALVSIGGWAAHARYVQWEAELRGETDETIVDILAIRLSFGYALFAQHRNDAFAAAWQREMQRAALEPRDERLGDDRALSVDMLAHEAYERAFRRRFFPRLRAALAPVERPELQAVFCIDVRSERFRRALEMEGTRVQTLGFAGFFGFPIEYVRFGEARGAAQCPALVRPAYVVGERIEGAPEREQQRARGLRALRRTVAKNWKGFRSAAISSFTFVETAGLLSALKLAIDAMARTRPPRDPLTDGLGDAELARLVPALDADADDGRATGIPFADRVALAESALRGMSLTREFAPLVLLVGHGSTTENNPYAASLDCGACGGHTGEANARIAAAVLNDAEVRRALRSRGIAIPDHTRFVAALHDTTTDAVTFFDAAGLGARLDDARRLFASAGSRVRRERSRALGETSERGIVRRAHDWSQVRPEWGLAGNAAFIVAPRDRTRGADLDGRAFLHEYDARLDADGSVLESIMTAPLVVGSWINLQYFASTVNNGVFGSGTKVLHNVTGGIGVIEGNGGDLRAGLPLQSLHDGERFVHEPVRLNVFVEASLDAIDRVLHKHDAVRELVENRWIHLFRMGSDGVTHRCAGVGRWHAVEQEDPQ